MSFLGSVTWRRLPPAFVLSDETDDALNSSWVLEVLLIVVSLGIATLAFQLESGTSLVLQLYYLPVVLGGFYLGRYRAGAIAFLCVLFGGIAAYRHLTQMSLDAERLAAGLEYVVWASSLGLTAALVGTLSDERRRAFEQLRESHVKDVLSDSLTGIANRRAFDAELARRLAEWNRYETPFALMLVDIDHFKDFNDRYGHQAGDVVLKDVAGTIELALRETDFVARYGGEEFCAILPGACAESAMAVTERVRRLIEKSHFRFTRLKLTTTVSVGVAMVMEGDDAVTLIQRTDGALYASKEGGRNCAHFHDGHKNERFGEGSPLVADQRDDGRSGPQVNNENAYFDSETGLPTRRVFVEELTRRTAEAHRYHGDLAIWIVEFADCADVADRDPRAANKAMVAVARLLRAGLREPDLVTRYSENQFAVILPATPFNSLLVAARRISSQISRYTDLEYKWLKIAVGIGAARPVPEESATCLLERAQSAVKSAIAEGGNRMFMHDRQGVVAAEPIAEDTGDASQHVES